MIDVSALPSVMPLPKRKPSSKKRSFNEVLSKQDNKEKAPANSQQHCNAAANMWCTLLALQQLSAMLLPVQCLSWLANQKQLGKLASRFRQSGCLDVAIMQAT